MSVLTVDPTLTGELWISFAAMLRSYAGAAAEQTGEAPRIAQSDSSMIIEAGSARLQVQVDAEGVGNWRTEGSPVSPSEGGIRLLPEGRIALEANVLELDHAAIDLIAALIASAKSAREGS